MDRVRRNFLSASKRKRCIRCSWDWELLNFYLGLRSIYLNMNMGPFKFTSIPMGGLVCKIPWKLNSTRKANVRAREKNLQIVEDVLKASVDIKAFHKQDPYAPVDIEKDPRSRYFINVLRGKKSVHKFLILRKTSKVDTVTTSCRPNDKVTSQSHDPRLLKLLLKLV